MKSWLQSLTENLSGGKKPEGEEEENSMLKKAMSVRVKAGIKDEDFDADLGGWQGRLTDKPEGGYITIAWDSITLRAMPAEMITACEVEGLDWETYGLAEDDVEPAPERDTPADVEAAIAELKKLHAWDYLGDEAELIREVLAGLDPDDEAAILEAWADYMQVHMTFPFEAKIDEVQERGPLQAGDKVRVSRITEIIEPYGILVDVMSQKIGSRVFPLSNLEARDHKSENYDIVQNYRVWFANRQ